MKWTLLIFGTLSLFVGWAIVQLGKGVTFTHGGYEEWDAEFLAQWRECCMVTDLKAGAPFLVVGVVLVMLGVWQFIRRA